MFINLATAGGALAGRPTEELTLQLAVLTDHAGGPPSTLTLTHEPIKSVPLLLGGSEPRGIRDVLDAHVTPHGAWQGARVGPLGSLRLCHILAERAHGLVAGRHWVAARAQTFHTLLEIPLRAPDCPDDRLGNVRSRLGAETTQAPLDRAMLEKGVRVYRLPPAPIRLASTRVRVYHNAPTDRSLRHQGPSTDHRPDLRPCQAMLATRDPLGLPLGCQPVAGQRADAGVYGPADEAAVNALGPAEVLGVGDSPRGALATRGHIVAGQSCYLWASPPPSATAELAHWRAQALARAAMWQCLEKGDPQTGAVLAEGMLDEWARAPRWPHPVTQAPHTWTERVLVVRSSADPVGLRQRRARALARLTDDLVALWQPPGRGRKRSRSREELERTVAERLALAGLSGVVPTAGAEETRPAGSRRWLVAAGGGRWPRGKLWWIAGAGRSTSPTPPRRPRAPRRG